ncbi:MAG: adenylate/guanylate cyclase domain-containing protein [Gammaproteobacteria bacterium]|nr:MAG: adenylate/guanylate cyclase domain-containing protein [Gammaproteobacteria bacterium]
MSTAADLLTYPQLEICPLVVTHVSQIETLEACRQLRLRPETALLPQAALADNDIWRQSAYESGVDAVFAPTTTDAEILARLQTLLKRRQLFSQWKSQRAQAAEDDREKLSTVFRRYVSGGLVDEIIARMDGDMASLTKGSRAHAAVMFADMRGFTGIAEKLAPAQVFELLNEFFAALTAVAFRYDGTVFNMAGDSLMVGFGVPIEQEDGGVRALRAAREMLSGFSELAERWQRRYGIDTGLGIGINEGEVIAGNVGSEQYMNYTLIGDTVNIAARLSQRARAGEVLFSNALKLSLDNDVDSTIPMLALPPLTLRGRSNPIDIFCVPIEKRINLRH